jgi:hypothetical protein
MRSAFELPMGLTDARNRSNNPVSVRSSPELRVSLRALCRRRAKQVRCRMSLIESNIEFADGRQSFAHHACTVALVVTS